jgi:hypothetical protein
MGYFREVNADDFDRECAEDDLHREARESGFRSAPLTTSDADRARIRAELDEARRVRLEREQTEAEASRANQERMRLEEKAAHAYVRALDWVYGPFAMSGDQRDLTPEPPAYLDLNSVRKMREMVKDAAAHGDRPWPYARDAA